MELRPSERARALVRETVSGVPAEQLPAGVRRCLDRADAALALSEVRWLRERAAGGGGLRALLEDGEMVLPSIITTPRSPELEARCRQLRAQQENDVYRNMVRNVDNSRLNEPSLNIGKQLREVNAQLVEVGQVLFSVLAAFLFGYMAAAVMAGGTADTARRILAGLACALVVLIAEGYFLVRYLSTCEHAPAATLAELASAAKARQRAAAAAVAHQ